MENRKRLEQAVGAQVCSMAEFLEKKESPDGGTGRADQQLVIFPEVYIQSRM
jgi:hypothetical protein